MPAERPSARDILTTIAQVESLDATLRRFPGLSREELLAILGVPVAADPIPASSASAPRGGGAGVAVGTLVINTDGACRGNPGDASIGVVVREDGQIIHTISRAIGRTTSTCPSTRQSARGCSGPPTPAQSEWS